MKVKEFLAIVPGVYVCIESVCGACVMQGMSETISEQDAVYLDAIISYAYPVNGHSRTYIRIVLSADNE